MENNIGRYRDFQIHCTSGQSDISPIVENVRPYIGVTHQPSETSGQLAAAPIQFLKRRIPENQIENLNPESSYNYEQHWYNSARSNAFNMSNWRSESIPDRNTQANLNRFTNNFDPSAVLRPYQSLRNNFESHNAQSGAYANHDFQTYSAIEDNAGVNIVQSTKQLSIENNDQRNTSMTVEPKDQRSSLKRNLPASAEDQSGEPPNKKRRERETRVFTGNIKKVIQWHKTAIENFSLFCLYEVYAPCLLVRDGTYASSKYLLLRDDTGPVLQVTYYETEELLDKNIGRGSFLRCFGRMTGNNNLIAMTIRIVPPEIKNHLRRVTFISEHSMNRIKDVL